MSGLMQKEWLICTMEDKYVDVKAEWMWFVKHFFILDKLSHNILSGMCVMLYICRKLHALGIV